MGYPTPIEWTDATWNPIGGCSIKSPACKPCYAMGLAGTRLKKHPLYKGTTDSDSGRPVFNGTMTAAKPDAHVWTWPLRWRGAKRPKLGAGKRSLIFVGDMADLFHENRERAPIDKTVGTIVNSEHIGQLLTKRPKVMADYFEALPSRSRDWDCDSLLDFMGHLPTSFWVGTSAERQKEFDDRWRDLRRLAELGFTVFISYEPAMGPLDLPKDFLELGRRAQVIAGGVSGRWPWRPQPNWFRSVRDQCAGAGVAFFFKQWGEHQPTDVFGVDEAKGDVCEDGQWFARVGKKAAGRLLDGREWNEFPQAA